MRENRGEMSRKAEHLNLHLHLHFIKLVKSLRYHTNYKKITHITNNYFLNKRIDIHISIKIKKLQGVSY